MPAEFHFLRPGWLLLLPLLLGMVPLLCRARAAGGAWRRVIDPALLPHLLESVAPQRRCLPALLLALLWVLMVLALAGPTWEREPTPLLEARQFHVVLLDLSPTMNAADLAPSRLARARFEVLDLLRVAGEGQAALVAFGAEPYLVAPLTGDAETIALQVPLLETGLLPVPGERRTDLALALAGELLEGAAAPSGSVVLVSDGLAPRAASIAAAARLRSAGHRVHVLGVGTSAGAPLLQDGGRLLREADGAVRLARLDEDGLRALAAAGGGLYRPALAGDSDVQALVDAALRERAEGGEDAVERWRDLGPWLILAALPLALLGFRRGWLGPLLLVFVVLPPQAVRAGAWDDLWRTPDQQGARALEQGRAGAALDLFERPEWRAAAAHAAGDYAAALQALEGLPPAQSAYNRGNLLARQGDYAAAIEAYEAALAANPQDDDARHNRDLLRDLLARRQPSPQDPQAQSAADAAADPSQDRSRDRSDEAGQAQSAQQDGAEQGGDAGEAGDAAASGGGSDDGDADSGGAADGQATSADDTGSTAAENGDSAGSEPADQGTPGDAGDSAEAGSGASASTGKGNAGGAQAQGGAQGQGSGAGGGAQTAGEGGDRPSRRQGGAADAAAADSEGAQAGPEAGSGDGPPGSDPQAAADRTGAADGGGGDAPGDKSVEGAGDPAQAAGASAGGKAADAAAATEPDGQGTVDSDGPGGGERGSDQAGPDRSGEAGQDQITPRDGEGAEQGGDGGERGGGQGDVPGGAGAGGPEPDSGRGSAAADAASGGATQGGALPGGAGRGTGDSGRPGLADLLGEGPPAGAGQERRGVPGDGPDERRQALEQMLRTVEDDPGGLLRQRFLLQHLRRSGQLP